MICNTRGAPAYLVKANSDRSTTQSVHPRTTSDGHPVNANDLLHESQGLPKPEQRMRYRLAQQQQSAQQPGLNSFQPRRDDRNFTVTLDRAGGFGSVRALRSHLGLLLRRDGSNR